MCSRDSLANGDLMRGEFPDYDARSLVHGLGLPPPTSRWPRTWRCQEPARSRRTGNGHHHREPRTGTRRRGVGDACRRARNRQPTQLKRDDIVAGLWDTGAHGRELWLQFQEPVDRVSDPTDRDGRTG
jgi:hypothetical protein